ncbi:hypothetical protein K2P97_02795 [bacterium]|nr:hypothetical protein [bacterium]
MEKIEARKSIERNKAILTFAMIFLFSLIPSFILKFSDRKEYVSVALVAIALALLYKRIRRLNYKLTSIGQFEIK